MMSSVFVEKIDLPALDWDGDDIVWSSTNRFVFERICDVDTVDMEPEIYWDNLKNESDL